MEKVAHLQPLLLRSRRLSLGVVGVALLILASAVLLTTLQVREGIREQISSRDGHVLHAVAVMELANDLDQGLTGPLTDTASQLRVVLKTAQLKGVLGIRLFDPSGKPGDTFPLDVCDGELAATDLAAMRALKPVSRFHPAVRMSELFLTAVPTAQAPEQVLPLLEVVVPLHAPNDTRLVGIAQFLIEGHGTAAEYARLDRHLAWQASGAFLAGGVILALVIFWAFRRLRRSQALLAERTDNLIQANQELALAAKASALGTITAHLIHGLKNPLAGLQSYVASRGAEAGSGPESDWQQAVASTQRMQTLVNQVVSVLREEQTGTRYEVTLEELLELVTGRVSPLARDRGVRFSSCVTTEAILSNRVANLAALILENLVGNAVEATPPGKAVALSVARTRSHVVFEVRDEGPGFPASLPPFAPCRSAKEGGSGIGLALSKQLASHLGAGLELKSSTPAGCVFVLSLPVNLCAEKGAGQVSLAG
jgi:signal transduction histidine kinase